MTPRVVLAVLGLTAALAAVAAVALTAGTPRLDLAGLRDALLVADADPRTRLVVWELRLPRLLLSLLGGAALGLAGALLQDALRNPLAGPELLGVSAGASLVMALVIVLGLPVPFAAHPLYALAGGLAAGAVVLVVGRQARGAVGVVLVGAALSAVLNALVVAVVALGTPGDLNAFYQFLLGSLANRSWAAVRVVLPWVVLGVPLGLAAAGVLNALRLGDDVAQGLGVPVVGARRAIVAVAAGLTAAVVAVCGPIAFVALLAPHLVRLALRTLDARAVLPGAALAGAALLAAADLAARQAFAPREVAVGVWTTLVGAPVLLLLLRRRPWLAT